MIDGTPGLTQSSRVTPAWRDSTCHVSCDFFFNVIVYNSRVTSCGVTQLLVASRSLA
jgi:hypothetical protein